VGAVDGVDSGLDAKCSFAPLAEDPHTSADELCDSDDGSGDLRDLLLHDVRTPLATISGYAQLLRRRAGGNEFREAELAVGLRQIEEAAKRVEHLLLELADLVKPNRPISSLIRRTPVDLVALARRVATEGHAIGVGRQRTEFQSAVSELIGWWDERYLEHLIVNLVHNALKYSAHDRSVVVTVQREGDWAVLKVADQGVGIPPAEQVRVFERGYRASNVVGRSPGTGVGLSGAAWIAVEHGGCISINSQLGVGTTVTVRLPMGAPLVQDNQR
jgi:signal transduction histidine kinase